MGSTLLPRPSTSVSCTMGFLLLRCKHSLDQACPKAAGEAPPGVFRTQTAGEQRPAASHSARRSCFQGLRGASLPGGPGDPLHPDAHPGGWDWGQQLPLEPPLTRLGVVEPWSCWPWEPCSVVRTPSWAAVLGLSTPGRSSSSVRSGFHFQNSPTPGSPFE